MDAKAIHCNPRKRPLGQSPVFHLALILLALAFVASGCGRMQAERTDARANGYTLSLAVQPDPATMGHAQLLISLADSSGKPVGGAQVRVEGNMSHAGMVPVLADASGSQDGRYAVPFDWTMSGDWVVTVKATLPDGLTVTRDFPVTVK